MRDLKDRLRTVAQTQGGYLDMLGPVAQRSERLLTVPATAQTSRELAVAVSELHAMAGWAGFDAHLDDTARYHFDRAIALSSQVDDHYGASYAAYLSGVLNEERGHPNDALKLFQLGRVRLSDARDDARTPSLRGWLLADSAGALVNMDRPADARSELAAARDAWRPSSPDDQAELDFVSSLVEIALGRTETAEYLAASAVRHRNGTPDRRASLVERITWAQIHVNAGEPKGPAMAEQVIRDVGELRSNRARDRLGPLADALASRRASDSRELAVAARRVAAARV